MKVQIRKTLYLVAFSAVVLSPILGRGYARYLIGLHVVLLFWVLLRPVPKTSLLYLYVAANIAALLLHFGDAESMLNAGSLIVSSLAIGGIAWVCRFEPDRTVERGMWICLAVSLGLSPILTAIGWSTAPYPWEAFYSDARLLLLMGDVGHTPSLWVTAFLMAYVLHRRGSLIVLLFLAALLLATKSRLALVYLVNLSLMALAYRGFPLARRTIWLAPVAFSIAFFVLAIAPVNVVNLAATQLQKQVGSMVRITPGEEFDSTVFTGRDVLNRALFVASFEQPLRGLGDSAPILHYGVDKDGYVAYDPEAKVSSSESVMRLAVKYGWPYFLAVIAFLFAIASSFKRLPYRERVLKTGIWGMCLESVVAEGGMEHFYDASALFLLLLCLFYFQATSRRHRPQHIRSTRPLYQSHAPCS